MLDRIWNTKRHSSVLDAMKHTHIASCFKWLQTRTLNTLDREDCLKNIMPSKQQKFKKKCNRVFITFKNPTRIWFSFSLYSWIIEFLKDISHFYLSGIFTYFLLLFTLRKNIQPSQLKKQRRGLTLLWLEKFWTLNIKPPFLHLVNYFQNVSSQLE